MHHYLEEGKASGAPKFGTNLPTSVHPTDKQYSITQFATVFSIAKRLEELKNPRFLSETKAAEEAQSAVVKESPRIEIVTHCSKDAFMENSLSVQNTIYSSRDSLNNQTLHVCQNPASWRSQNVPKDKEDIVASSDDISENSFTVVHKAVKVSFPSL
uniref:Centrosomal protein 126 n=1 Tax=Ascaris lumbricoides TaxID=6252 RepID=A0A0M3IW77_ASCLU